MFAQSGPLNKEGFYSAAPGEGENTRSYLPLTGQLFERASVCVKERKSSNDKSCALYRNTSLSQETSINPERTDPDTFALYLSPHH